VEIIVIIKSRIKRKEMDFLEKFHIKVESGKIRRGGCSKKCIREYDGEEIERVNREISSENGKRIWTMESRQREGWQELAPERIVRWKNPRYLKLFDWL